MFNLENPSIEALTRVINKSRVHFYKPIQIAEILYRHRTLRDFGLNDLEAYRNLSKKWRDQVTKSLIGNVCTSSARFQDDLFNENALPPATIAKLGQLNEANPGIVEAYIYYKFSEKLNAVYEIGSYIDEIKPKDFQLNKIIEKFETNPSLKKSMDKVYEITTYALFMTIVRALEATVTLEILNKDSLILEDFEDFTKKVLNIDATNTKLVSTAELFRVGVANASDAGIDMWANFGPVIQVKHLTLSLEKGEEITSSLSTDKIVIVCKDSERTALDVVLRQIDWGSRVQCIVTLQDLSKWYDTCFSERHIEGLGVKLLEDFKREFNEEFPSNANIMPFMKSRGYLTQTASFQIMS